MGSHALLAEFGVSSEAETEPTSGAHGALRRSLSGPDAHRDACAESKTSGTMDDHGAASGAVAHADVGASSHSGRPYDIGGTPSKFPSDAQVGADKSDGNSEMSNVCAVCSSMGH